jgi:hypothetical protein
VIVGAAFAFFASYEVEGMETTRAAMATAKAIRVRDQEEVETNLFV